MKLIFKTETSEYEVDSRESTLEKYIERLIDSLIKARLDEQKQQFIKNIEMLVDNAELGNLDNRQSLIGVLKMILKNIK